MDIVTVLWSLSAAASITLAVLCGLMWLGERHVFSNLMLCLLGIATATSAYIELGMMYSATVREYGEWLRWYHLPIFFGILAQVLFVHFYLGASRKWLMWAAILARVAVLATNFMVDPNVNFSSIDSLRTISILGIDVSAIGAASARAAVQPLAAVSLALVVAYILDCAARRWRAGSAASRRKTLAIMAMGVTALVCALYTQLLIFGVVSGPTSNIPWFLAALLMMAHETGREFILNRRARLELAELRGQVAQVERVNLLGQLASALAHELSQPLTAISINLRAARRSLKRERPDVEEALVILDDISLDDARAVEMIERMRQLFKQRAIALEPLQIEDVVRNAVSLVRAEANSRNVGLRLVFQPGLPHVSGDRVHLSQVLLNLMLNSFQAVQSRAIDARHVVIEARSVEATGDVEIGVQDSGTGVPHAIVRQIFEPLFTTKPEGMGMGLSLCRTIIEAHGGRLWVERPAAQEGAIFRFTLKPA